jgi:hypothetical protein
MIVLSAGMFVRDRGWRSMQPNQEGDSDQQNNKRNKKVNVGKHGSGDLKKSHTTFDHDVPIFAFARS